jgi:hypothetical protein
MCITIHMPQGKPYSSCDACRHSRLGCNSRLQTGDSCFNCARKGLTCTFSQSRIRLSDPNKVSASQKLRANAQRNTTASATSTNPTADPPALVDNTHLSAPLLSTSQDSQSRTQQALQLHQILWNVFTTLLEPRIGLWIGGSGCPFVQSSTVGLPLRKSPLVCTDA